MIKKSYKKIYDTKKDQKCVHVKVYLENKLYTVLNKNWKGWNGNVELMSEIKNEIKEKIDLIISNHLVLQPVYAVRLQKELNVKHFTYIHGSSLNFCVRKNEILQKISHDITMKNVDNFLFLSGNSKLEFVEYYKQYKDLKSRCHIILSPGVKTELFNVEKMGTQKLILKKIKDLIPNFVVGRELIDKNEFSLKFKDNKSSEFIKKEFQKSLEIKYDGYDEGFFESLKSIDYENSNIVIYFGRFLFTKGTQHILLSIKDILEKNPNTYFLFVGFGAGRIYLESLINAMNFGNKELFLELLKHPTLYQTSPSFEDHSSISHFLDEVDVDSYLEFTKDRLCERIIITGLLDHSILSKVLSISDISILPSIFPEAFGLVSIESLATGCIPLTTLHSGFANVFPYYEDLLINAPLNCKKEFKNLILDENLIQNMSDDINLLISKIKEVKKAKGCYDMKLEMRNVVLKNFSWKEHYINYLKRLL